MVCARYEVSTAAYLMFWVFWDVTQIQEYNITYQKTWVANRALDPWRWRQYVPSKYGESVTLLLNVATQKTRLLYIRTVESHILHNLCDADSWSNFTMQMVCFKNDLLWNVSDNSTLYTYEYFSPCLHRIKLEWNT